jgi:hypothetical protein
MEMKEELARLRYQLEVLTNQQQVFLTKWDIETGQLYAKHRMNLWSTQQELATEKTARMRAEARSVEDVALRDDAEAGVEEMEAMRPESFKFGKLGKEVEKPGRSD